LIKNGGDSVTVIKVAPERTPILKCYKCQLSFEIDRDPAKPNPALEAFSALHLPHGQLFIGTLDENGKFKAIDGPGFIGDPKDYIHGRRQH
jgi:hypothetical protein